jgi:subtilisin family serine protease
MFSLRQWLSGFPGTFKFGWGQRLMGLDQVPEQLTGKGVKIAIIDSGADNTHPVLRHLQAGMDMTNNKDDKTWGQDIVGHGTHCAGIITARSTDQIAFRGFAPEAEIHIFKIFPGGQFSNLLDALDECMALDIDVVNMSLGSDQMSQAVEQKLEEAVHDGVACIVAAGNSGGSVQYPASSPNVLAISAIGRLKEYPSESWDARTVTSTLVTPDGVFSPSFSCYGPQVGVCAPGVSIVSTVPDNGFEPQSGTSMAAPHVAGFAALLLAHHPVFQGPMRTRGPQRVAALFNMIKSACIPSHLGPERTGYGVPSLSGLVQVLSAPQPAPGAQAGVPSARSAEVPVQPVPAAPSSGAATIPPQPAVQIPPAPPNVDPYLWQTVIWPQVATLLVTPGGVPLLLQLIARGAFGPQLSSYISSLLSQALAGGMPLGSVAPFQAAPLMPQGAVGGQLGGVLGGALGGLMGQPQLGTQFGNLAGRFVPWF